MAEGKWIAELTATTPLADAARWVLAVRLEVVRDYLGLALRAPEKDVEYVHQLRVGTRRAGAALKIFAECLPEKAYRRARKYLRRQRRAAGGARDWDVFLAALAEPKQRRTPRNEPGLNFLDGYAVARRAAAQDLLAETSPDFPFCFERFLADTLGAVHEAHAGKGERTLIDLARPLLTDLLRNLDQAAQRDLEDYENLHQVRIAGKRLRYAMEVFASCFAPPFKEQLYPAVEAMQDILGRANDSHVGSQRLEEVRDQLKAFQPAQWKRCRPGIHGLLRQHRQRLPKLRQQFITWWQQWQEAGVEKAFADLLQGAPERLEGVQAPLMALTEAVPNQGDGPPLPADGASAPAEASAEASGRGTPRADVGVAGNGPGGGGAADNGTGAGAGAAGNGTGPPTLGAGGANSGPPAGAPTGRGAQTPP
jgi:CHAD domain-containing protein